MNRGQVGELERGTNCFHRVTWLIPNFMSLPKKVNIYYLSPHFYFLNLRWFLRIYPNDKCRGRNWIRLYLVRSSEGPPLTVDCIFGIRKADGMEEHFYHFKREKIFSEEEPEWGAHRFLQRSDLLTRESELAPSDDLTVVCILSSNVEDQTLISHKTQTEEDLADGVAKEEFCTFLDTKGGAIVLKHFQDLLLNSKDHDVTLKVKDQEFRAHKSILRVRSPVFSAMFAHTMAENDCGEVCIEDCEPNAFSEFLKYVYVGKFENMSPATAVNLYYIADKYDFPDLKKTCVEFLKASLATNVICDVVPLAMSHGEDELLECAMEFFSKHIMETLMTVEWQHFIRTSPDLANELNIKAMKISHKSTE